MTRLLTLVLLLGVTPAVQAEGIEANECRDPFPRDDSPREEVAQQCRQIGSMPDGTPILDPEDCLTVYREGGRYSVERFGKVLGSDYVLPPDLRGTPTDPDQTAIVGKLGFGWMELIVSGRSIGTYDVNRIYDLGRGRFVFSNDFRHVAFIEHREDGSWWANVDGRASRIRGPVEAIEEITFAPHGCLVRFDYLASGHAVVVDLPTYSPPIVIIR